jgi:uncharacterized UPF0146 family protein
MTSKISYGKTEEAWRGYEHLIAEIIENNNGRRICDIGGGANPLLTPDYINQKGIDYSVLDISEAELNKAPKQYNKIVADISSPEFSPTTAGFDLVFSKMLAEHIKDGEQFHKNVLRMLTDDGLAVHFFPTLYALPFLVNYLTPEVLADKLLNVFAVRDRYQFAKFPAHYSWCRGPIRSQRRKFEKSGYEIIQYRGFFGHGGYYDRIPILKRLHELKTGYLLKRPNPLFTSYAYIVLKKA